jgi:hypothetical protein
MANAVIDEKKEVVKIVEIIYRRPDYINRAQRKYYDSNKSNPEFIEKERERLKKWREANRDHVNEQARIRRQKKKAEEKAKQDTLLNKELEISNKAKEDLPNLETLSV